MNKLVWQAEEETLGIVRLGPGEKLELLAYIFSGCIAKHALHQISIGIRLRRQ